MPDAIRLTKRTIDNLKPGQILWDSDVKGFGVRCQTKFKVYVLKVRISGRQRWLVIGSHGAPWTVETARHEAQRLWGDIRSGTNIAALRDAKKKQPTVAELCARYLDDYAREHKKLASVEADQRNICNHIVPLLGTRFVADVTKSDIEALQRQVREGKTRRAVLRVDQGGKGTGRPVLGGSGAANRVLSLLSKMFNLAEDWGLRPSHTNPCHRVSRYPERTVERFLSTAELKLLGATLAELEKAGSITPFVAAAIRLLILTGARLREIQTLKWSYVDIERRLLLLPDSKTGAKPIVLNQPAIEILQNLPRLNANPYVIVGYEDGTYVKYLQGPWRAVRAKAGLHDVRLHDLRHSYASFALLQGGNLQVIGKILGHASPQTTARYIHLADDPVVKLAEATGQALSTAMNATET